jgi:hypothetical protein
MKIPEKCIFRIGLIGGKPVAGIIALKRLLIENEKEYSQSDC